MRAIPVFVALGLTWGCNSTDSPTATPTKPDSAPFTRDSSRLVQTSSLSYAWTASGNARSLSVPVTFSNTTAADIFVVNCQGDVTVSLEKLTAGTWIAVWSGIPRLCLSDPMVVPSGGRWQHTVQIHGSLPPSTTGPAFATADLVGTFRLRLGRFVSSYKLQPPEPGPALPDSMTVSNAFVIQ